MPHKAAEAVEVLELERFLPYRLSVLTNTVSGAIARFYSERFDLGVAEWRVMAVLGRFPGISANDVAERTAMDKVQVSRAVASLLASGRIARTRDGKDGRVWRLSLTSAGLAIYAEIVPLARSFEKRLTAALDGAELQALDRLLSKLTGEARGL